MKFFFLMAIYFYRATIAPWFGGACRFFPSCSVYSEQAIQKKGTAKGIMLTFKRLLKCHPFHRGGWDPVE